MPKGQEEVAVLLTSMGAPARPEDVEPFLVNVRGGRPVPPEAVEEVRERYRATSARPRPVLDIFREIAKRLEEHQRDDQSDPSPWRVSIGFQHWHPYIRDAYADLRRGEPQRLVCLCLAPHYSPLTVGRQFAAVEEARTSFGDDFPVAYVRSWGRQPGLVRALTENITAALEGFPPAIRGRVPLLFTAHSLPAWMAATGDPYPDEVRGTMDAVCEHLGERTARLAYHSRGRSGEWLGPDMRATLEELAGAGHRQVLVVPIGFVTDHVDVLYDVDIELRAVAARKGIQLERISMLNSDRRLVETLATVVRSHLGPHTG